MHSMLKWHKIGSWSFIILGAGHLLTALLAHTTPEQMRMLQEMSDFVIPMPGWNTTLLSLYMGFSIAMGVLLIAIGILNLLIPGAFPVENTTAKLRPVALFNIVLSLIILALSVKFFFIVPVVFSTVATIVYALFFLRLCRESESVRT